jgi:hypothetical protein
MTANRNRKRRPNTQRKEQTKKQKESDQILRFFLSKNILTGSCVKQDNDVLTFISTRLQALALFHPRNFRVTLLITNNAFCIAQRATAQSQKGIFRDCRVAEAPPGFQAGWSDYMHFFSLFLFILFAQSSQVKLLITNNAFCIVQRATAQSKTGNFSWLWCS